MRKDCRSVEEGKQKEKISMEGWVDWKNWGGGGREKG